MVVHTHPQAEVDPISRRQSSHVNENPHVIDTCRVTPDTVNHVLVSTLVTRIVPTRLFWVRGL